jgi:hypothetical protein
VQDFGIVTFFLKERKLLAAPLRETLLSQDFQLLNLFALSSKAWCSCSILREFVNKKIKFTLTEKSKSTADALTVWLCIVVWPC